MRFSLFYDFTVLPRKEASELYREIEAQAIVADRLGFDGIWLAEQHDVLRSITLLGQEVLPRLQQPYPMTELAIS